MLHTTMALLLQKLHHPACLDTLPAEVKTFIEANQHMIDCVSCKRPNEFYVDDSHRMHSWMCPRCGCFAHNGCLQDNRCPDCFSVIHPPVVVSDDALPQRLALEDRGTRGVEKQYLVVPFTEKDACKRAGGQWDGTKKMWYVPEGLSLKPFVRWLSKGSDEKKQTPPQKRARRNSD